MKFDVRVHKSIITFILKQVKISTQTNTSKNNSGQYANKISQIINDLK